VGKDAAGLESVQLATSDARAGLKAATELRRSLRECFGRKACGPELTRPADRHLAADGPFHDDILKTSVANLFASFQAMSIDGLPAQVTFGTAYDLSITGDLTIHGVTRPVTFTGTVTPVSEGRLEGTASVTLEYADFDIRILRLPEQVASVGQLVTLGIDFVAEVE